MNTYSSLPVLKLCYASNVYVPLPIIVHITSQKLTENGPFLRAPFVFLGFFCECFGSGFDWDFKHINPPLEVTHSTVCLEVAG